MVAKRAIVVRFEHFKQNEVAILQAFKLTETRISSSEDIFFKGVVNV